MRNHIPTGAMLLGYAGLIPPAILTIIAVLHLGVFAESAPGFVRSYGAIILSFLGGTWWAFAIRRERPPTVLLAISVVPALAGWAAMFWFKPALALFALAALLIASLAFDRWLQRSGLAPAWWMQLRAPLSLLLALCCGLSGWTLMR